MIGKNYCLILRVVLASITTHYCSPHNIYRLSNSYLFPPFNCAWSSKNTLNYICFQFAFIHYILFRCLKWHHDTIQREQKMQQKIGMIFFLISNMISDEITHQYLMMNYFSNFIKVHFNILHSIHLLKFITLIQDVTNCINVVKCKGNFQA